MVTMNEGYFENGPHEYANCIVEPLRIYGKTSARWRVRGDGFDTAVYYAASGRLDGGFVHDYYPKWVGEVDDAGNLTLILSRSVYEEGRWVRRDFRWTPGDGEPVLSDEAVPAA